DRVDPRHGRGGALQPADPAPRRSHRRRRTPGRAARPDGRGGSGGRLPPAGGGHRAVSVAATLATARRVARQLRRDHRTIALVLVAPPGILALLDWSFTEQPQTMDR